VGKLLLDPYRLTVAKAMIYTVIALQETTSRYRTCRMCLERQAIELHDGKGFVVLRGLDPSRYSVEDGLLVWLGIQSYIAEQRARQDDKGNMLGKSKT
jgi:hypothetical protein